MVARRWGVCEPPALGHRSFAPTPKTQTRRRSPIAYFAVTGEALAGVKGAARQARRGIGDAVSLAVDEDAGVGTNTVPQKWERRSEMHVA